ncbi:Protein-tyrosine phosphatase, partial [Teladorsagia circumcincta]
DDVVNMGSAELEAATIARRKALGKQLSVSPTKKVKKSTTHDEKELSHSVRTRRSEIPMTAYIAARIEADEMRRMYSEDRQFVVGDDKIYNGFNNFPLEPNTKYRLMMRSFAKADGRRKDEFDKRAPMGEKLTKLYSDSALTEPFTTRAALRSGAKTGGVWLIGPLIALLIIAILIGMLEFESIETGQQFTWENSNSDINKHKNRYANVVAYDHSRVVLSSMEGIPGTDYINANYIDGYDKPKAYIATQGPLPETFGDFWRMVWEEGSSTIVMLTNLEERSRVKCDQYWPTRGSSTYGEVQVTLLETTVLAHYTMRAFRIQVVGEMEMREIRHLQYTAWPDHGVPDHPTPFLIFLKRVKTLNPPDAGPIISHCSAGIGRTGAFIVVDCMLERLRYENTVDIFGCVTSLRSQRSYMVQTEDQYIFIHDAVLDAVNSGSTEVPAVKLRQHVMALQQMAPMEGAAGMELEFR